MKEGIHPKYHEVEARLRLWGDLENALDQARAPPRNLLELPSVLHWPAEAHRHGRPRRALHEEARGTDIGEPEESGKVEEGNNVRSVTSFRSIRARRRPAASPRAGPLPVPLPSRQTVSPSSGRVRGARDKSPAPRSLP